MPFKVEEYCKKKILPCRESIEALQRFAKELKNEYADIKSFFIRNVQCMAILILFAVSYRVKIEP